MSEKNDISTQISQKVFLNIVALYQPQPIWIENFRESIETYKCMLLYFILYTVSVLVDEDLKMCQEMSQNFIYSLKFDKSKRKARTLTHHLSLSE